MQNTNESVFDRIEQARIEITPLQLAVSLAIIAALGFTLLFLQEPMAHDSLHNFRHSIGITCH